MSLPNEKNVQKVQHLRQLIEKAAILISTNYSGSNVKTMTDLRKALRDSDVEFHVVKNRLAKIAADAAGNQYVKDIIQGPTGIAIGFTDPVKPAKALKEFIHNTKTPIEINGGVMGQRFLSVHDINNLADLPPKNELIAKLAGQIQSPATNLVTTINSPISGLARLLQNYIDSIPATESLATKQ